METVYELMTPTSFVGIIMAIAELFKLYGFPKKYIPIVDVVLGLLIGIFVFGIGLDVGIAKGVLTGVALGLSSCGLYSGAKNVFVEVDENED